MTRCGGSLGEGGRGIDALDPWEADRVQQAKSVQKEKQERGLLLYIKESSCVYIISLTHLNSTARKGLFISYS